MSLSSKDSCHRKDGVNQTFQFGKSDIVLRVYDKVAEIEEQNHKDWFYTLWQTDENVWRIEWKCRKPALKRFGLYTIDDLLAGQGDILRYLAAEHDTLRSPNQDSNRSRWPLHPLWTDVQAQIGALPCQGVYREIDEGARLAEKEFRIAQSVYGYIKQEAALNCVRRDIDSLSAMEAFDIVKHHIEQLHNPFTWKVDVEKKIQQLRLGR